MSNGIKKFPKVIWILLDLSNGNYPSLNYTWWFKTRREAREKLKEHNSNPRYAKLVGPVKYVLETEISGVVSEVINVLDKFFLASDPEVRRFK